MKFGFDSRIIVKVKGEKLLDISVLEMLLLQFNTTNGVYLRPDLFCELFVTDKNTGESYVSEFASAELCNHNDMHIMKPVTVDVCKKCNRIVRSLQ